MGNRVVITGIGVVSALGIGVESLWCGLANGLTGIKPITSFDTSRSSSKKAAQVAHFNVHDYLSLKGLGHSSRSAQFVCTAAKLAFESAELDLPKVNKEELGIVLGTAFGSANSMATFDEECLRDGAKFVDPMSFPNTVNNSPASHLSVLLRVEGLSMTLSTGSASGLDVIDYAARVLAKGQVRIVLAGGYEELSLLSHAYLSEAKFLSGSRDHDVEYSVPLDRNRNGFFLGEGAAVLVLERLDDALARGSRIIAEVAGFGTSFCLKPSQVVDSESMAMQRALLSAGLESQDIGCIFASANGSIDGDKAERLSIEKTFGSRACDVPATAIKSMIGECGGATGAMQVIAAALSSRFNAVPPTKDFQEHDPGSLLKRVSSKEQIADCDAVLVNSFNGQHQNSSLVVKKFMN